MGLLRDLLGRLGIGRPRVAVVRFRLLGWGGDLLCEVRARPLGPLGPGIETPLECAPARVLRTGEPAECEVYIDSLCVLRAFAWHVVPDCHYLLAGGTLYMTGSSIAIE